MLSQLKILMQIRPNALTQRGGDTVVMESIRRGLSDLGHRVDLDLGLERNPKEYDLVHLYNFCTPEVTEIFSKRAYEAGVPIVVTTLYEDWQLFYAPMVEYYSLLEAYVSTGQQPGSWDDLLKVKPKFPCPPIPNNSFVARHADALVVTGANEVRSIERDYPEAKNVVEFRCGARVPTKAANPDLIRTLVGRDDFILCVGRLEQRKNQLMLLKALESSDKMLVFATSGFTYQPEYRQLCERFRRRGRTLFLEELSPEFLASAYSAARVHALPSWYELPGLVSIEAAHYGANIAVSDFGTIRDYLGDDAFYCSPDDPDSVLHAVDRAWDAPRSNRLRERVQQFTWENATERYLEIYHSVLEKRGKFPGRKATALDEGISLLSRG